MGLRSGLYDSRGRARSPGGHFVCAEVIGDDDVHGEGGHEDLFDIGEEARPVDGAVEDPGRGQASHPQRCEKRTGLPPGARRVVVDAGPAEGPTGDCSLPVSSRKTRRVGSQVGAAACHTTRAAATSGRSCSEGRTVFFDGQRPEPPPRARSSPDRARPSGAIRLLRDQRGQGVQQHPAPPVPLDAGSDFALPAEQQPRPERYFGNVPNSKIHA